MKKLIPITLLALFLILTTACDRTPADSANGPATTAHEAMATATPETIPSGSLRDVGTVFEVMGPKEEAILRGWAALVPSQEIRTMVDTDGGQGVTEQTSLTVTLRGASGKNAVPLQASFVADKGWLAVKLPDDVAPPVTIDLTLTAPDSPEATATVTFDKIVNAQ